MDQGGVLISRGRVLFSRTFLNARHSAKYEESKIHSNKGHDNLCIMYYGYDCVTATMYNILDLSIT